MVILLMMPMLNKNLGFVKSAGLKGDVRISPDINFSWKKWFDGSYQKGKEEYINSNVGFYPDFIRINNQIDFSLFGILHAKDVHEGTNHFLYEGAYIDSYLGTDKLANSLILKNSRHIKWIQDSLTALGKTFLFVIAPNKAFYYPDELPDKYKKTKKKKRNYEQYIHYFDSLGIAYIDFNGYFVKQKSRTKYPLITKFGTHWSSYGASVVADSIVRYLNIKHYSNALLVPEITYVESKTYNAHDKEAFDPLNLIVGWGDKELTAWPQYTFRFPKGKIKPKILFVADSYFWEIYEQKVMENVFSDNEFWYYNRDHWGKNHAYLGDAGKIKKLGINYLKSSDVIVLMASEFHLNCNTEGFMKTIKKMYK